MGTSCNCMSLLSALRTGHRSEAHFFWVHPVAPSGHPAVAPFSISMYFLHFLYETVASTKHCMHQTLAEGFADGPWLLTAAAQEKQSSV